MTATGTTGPDTDHAPVDPDLLALLREVLRQGELSDRAEQQVRGIGLDRSLWEQLDGLGLARLTAPEDAGGSGAGWPEAAALLAEAAAAAVHLPLAESDLLAGGLLRAAGVGGTDPAAIRTVAVLDGDGSAPGVPWAAEADLVVTVGPAPGGAAWVREVAPDALELTRRPASSGQPRYDLRAPDGPAGSRTELPPERAAELVRSVTLSGALARAVQCVGAMERIVELCVGHATVREQFGRPLARFQAVQHLVADIAAETALARAAVDAAVLEFAGSGPGGSRATTVVAAARSCVGHASSVVVRNAHQVHGAIGTTVEHPLQLFTLPVLDWRSEYGTTRGWDRLLGAAVRRGGVAPWDVVTGVADGPVVDPWAEVSR